MAKNLPAKKGVAEKAASPPVDEAVMLQIYRNVYATRQFELNCAELYRAGFIRGYLHPYLGEEAVAAGACAAVRKDDYIVSTHRGHGHCISKGAELHLMMAEIMGKATGYCRGRGGSMHISSKKDNNLGANGIVGGGIPIAAGAGMGIKVKGTDQMVVCFFSDGASNNGVFSESLNLAAVFNLPVIFMLENNHYAVSTRIDCSAGDCNLAGRGPAFGVPGRCIDGNDAVAVYLETKKAAERARNGEGPTLIEADTYRHGGHHVNDPGLYMPRDELEAWKARDPIIVLRSQINNDKKVKAVEEKVDQEMEAAIDYGKSSPDPSVEEFLASITDR
ncbi:MAG: thiamine pyrophosphate-dependent dehydrogenase E1 component subunit alpha [Desulfobacterales bacterium]|nr:MAG: thiamine pyrophosphate-dependent dehydrogenase E1 component subunit alpha [Desulfobacterales bacterium]